MKPIYLS